MIVLGSTPTTEGQGHIVFDVRTHHDNDGKHVSIIINGRLFFVDGDEMVDAIIKAQGKE